MTGGVSRASSRYFTANRLREWAWQGAFLAVIGAIIWFFASNTAENLARRNVPFGLSVLWKQAGFDIPFKLVEWQTTYTYGHAVYVVLLNTLLVSAMAVVTATILGVTLGIMRLSSNWLVRNAALCVGEVVKNTPQLVQIFFIYVAVLQALPQLRQSIQLGGSALLNVRGLFLPAPILGESATAIGWGFVAALVAFIALRVMAGRAQTARAKSRLSWISWTPFLLVLLAGWLTGAIAGWDEPKLDRFNIRGGFSLKPELLALWIGLSTYAAAFIADIVRAAILGIHKGQVEAAMSLGLTRSQALRLVILPQARRLIIPPLTSQFLNITKSSSLGASIAYPELVLMIGRTMLNQTGQAIESMTIVLSVFLIINLITAFLMNWYNRAVALKER